MATADNRQGPRHLVALSRTLQTNPSHINLDFIAGVTIGLRGA